MTYRKFSLSLSLYIYIYIYMYNFGIKELYNYLKLLKQLVYKTYGADAAISIDINV